MVKFGIRNYGRGLMCVWKKRGYRGEGCGEMVCSSIIIKKAGRPLRSPDFFFIAKGDRFSSARSFFCAQQMLRTRGGGMNRATHGSKTKRCFVFRAASAARSRRLPAHGEGRAQSVAKKSWQRIVFHTEKSRNGKRRKKQANVQ